MQFKVEAIIPAKLLADPKRLQFAIENSLDMRAEDVRVDFKVTTQTWTKQPTFIIAKSPGLRMIYTSNIIYKFVSGGTKRHYIYPKATRIMTRRTKSGHVIVLAPRLAFFRTGFRPKSRVEWIGSNKGAPASKDFSRPLFVNHPGNAARNYPLVVQRKWQKIFPTLMQRALDAEAARS